jgi:integrase-like protein
MAGAGLRTVTLPTVAAEALAEHLGVYAEAGPEGLVFSAERGGPIRRSNFTRRVWIPATRAAGVAGLRFHDLRHTAATLAVAAGASTRELMVRMGIPPRPRRCGTSMSWLGGTPPRGGLGRADPGGVDPFAGPGRRW